MMVLVTGGSSCGKSAFAESLCQAFGGSLTYLAAMKPFGEEGAARIRRHRAQRAGKGFVTVECFDGLDAVVASRALEGSTVLLECLGNVVANALFDDVGLRLVESVLAELAQCLDELALQCRHLVVVGNEVGCDGVSYPSETRAYQEVLGSLACRCAFRSDFVFECVAGFPLAVKRGDVETADGTAPFLLRRACGEAGR